MKSRYVITLMLVVLFVLVLGVYNNGFSFTNTLNLSQLFFTIVSYYYGIKIIHKNFKEKKMNKTN